VKNRQYNFLPIMQNVFVGATTRPNELTYSEDWLRPDYIPPQPVPAQAQPSPSPLAQPAPAAGPPLAAEAPAAGPPLAAEAPVTPNPTDGLHGLMVPQGVGP